MNITEPIKRNAQLFSQATAIFADGHGVNYGQLDRLIDAAAAHMSSNGLGAGAAVGVLVSDRYRHLVLTLALARLGIAAVVSSHVAGRPGKLAIKASFVDAGTQAVKGQAVIQVDGTWWRSLSAEKTAVGIVPHRDPDATCLIGSSSGTTGTPKGMALSHAQLGRRVFARPLSISWPSRPRIACTLGRESTYGFTTHVRALWAGGMLAFPGNSVGIADLVQMHQLNCLVMSPAQLQTVVEELPAGSGLLPSLETVELGGGMLPSRLAGEASTRLCPNIYVSYGAQEAGGVASAPLSVLQRQAGSVGFIAPGVEVQAVDAARRPLAAGVEGVIRIRSPNCIDAYLDDPASSARTFEDGWFYPGDIGAVSSAGLLTISGRGDELLNAGGVKVSPQVIEHAALMNKDVAEAAAFGVPDAKTGMPQIWLAIVQRNPVDLDALSKHCLQTLGAARTPRAILLLKSLPHNENGKLQRDQLVKMAATAKDARATKATPS